MTYKIPTDHKEIFTDRLLIITGVGRSGTTILGKLIASMKPTYYLFEPALMKYYLTLKAIAPGAHHGYQYDETFRAMLFEDYFMPLFQGRSMNLCERDWTFADNHWATNTMDVVGRWDLNRRELAMERMLVEKPLFVIKNPEFQPLMEVATEIFTRCRFIHVIRNGLNVVSSSIERGWYTDEYCNGRMIDWLITHAKCRIPWYLDDESRTLWAGWDQVTRAACIWRVLTEIGIKKNDIWGIPIYESFCANPERWVGLIAEYFNLEPTTITEKHIESIKSWKQESERIIQLSDIQEPERSKFKALMEELGYEC